jgi:hypothetical protein
VLLRSYIYSCEPSEIVPKGVKARMSFTLGFGDTAKYLSQDKNSFSIYHKQDDKSKLNRVDTEFEAVWSGNDVTIVTTVDHFCTWAIALTDIHSTRELTAQVEYSTRGSKLFSTTGGARQTFHIKATKILVTNLTDTELYVSSVPAQRRDITEEHGAEISLDFGVITEMKPTIGGSFTRKRSTVKSPAGNSNAPSDYTLIKYQRGDTGVPQKVAHDDVQTRVITYSLSTDDIAGTKTLQIKDNRVLPPGTLLVMLPPVVRNCANHGSRTFDALHSTIEPGKLAYAMKCGGVFTSFPAETVPDPTLQ